MEQYINKSTVVSKIKNLIERAEAERVLYPKTILAAKNYLLIEDYKKLLSIIDTLEVKEVDLEKEYDNEFFKDPVFGKLVNRNAGISIAKYFFELGLKAKGVNLEKLGEIARHLIAVKEHIEDMRLDKEEWFMLEKIGYPERFKAKKVE